MADREKRQQILSEAIQRFAATPRYSFLRALQVGRFLAPEASGIGVVSELTFEKLVELGSTKLTKLKWLNREQEQSLIQLLKVLGDTESNDATAALITPPKRPSRLSPNYVPEDEGEGLSSAEVENRLRSMLRELSSHPKFKSISQESLGSFWNNEWPRAPFEEAMTLNQLAEMDLALLWKKRTTTSGRLDRMAKAVESALKKLGRPAGLNKSSESGAAFRGPANDEMVKPRLAIVKQTPSKRRPRTTLDVAIDNHPWMGSELNLSTLERVAVRRLLEVVLRPEVRNEPIGQLAILMTETLTSSDFLSLLSARDNSEIATPGVGLWRALPEVQEQSLGLLSALQGPGTHISTLSRLCLAFKEEGEVGEMATLAIIKMLGAKEISVKGELCPGVFSLNPDLLEVVLGAIANYDTNEPLRALTEKIPALDVRLIKWLEKKLGEEKFKSSNKEP